jgi:hypothetical protein
MRYAMLLAALMVVQVGCGTRSPSTGTPPDPVVTESPATLDLPVPAELPDTAGDVPILPDPEDFPQVDGSIPDLPPDSPAETTADEAPEADGVDDAAADATAPDPADPPPCAAESDCDDHNPCTDDACSPVTGCVHVPNLAPCWDGNACTAGDACADGWCHPGAPVSCDDGAPCTDDACAPAAGCLHTPNEASCDDGNACTAGDRCHDGKCAPGPTASCDDGDACTLDACVPASGCTHKPGVPCNDGNPCTDDTCVPATGCTHTPNQAKCDDGDACTVGDQCKAGKCKPGPATGCPTTCPTVGGWACGGNGAPGDANTLYVCSAQKVWVVDHACGAPCQKMPSGVPDRCAADLVVPASLVAALDDTPYVEQSCKSTTWSGWPYAARKCTYTSGPMTTSVTVANPSPERVAKWIVDSAGFIPTLWKLRTSSPANWEKGLIAIAGFVMGQSSRIFPLEGGIIENMGSGYVNYPFDRGVAVGCSSGCYCRINSIHRTEWCGYREFLGAASYSACISQVGASGLTDAWGDECLQNHVAAWKADANQHFRAKAWKANQSVMSACPSYTACTPAEVVKAVKAALQ